MEDNLKEKARQQLNRLVSQLNDIEASKGDLDPDEYSEAKQDTLDQLEEFRKSLDKMELKLESILDSFQTTSDIIKLFMSKTSDGLRQKLQEIDRDLKTGKISHAIFHCKKVDALQELAKLDVKLLTPEEKDILSNDKSNDLEILEENNQVVSAENVLKLMK